MQKIITELSWQNREAAKQLPFMKRLKLRILLRRAKRYEAAIRRLYPDPCALHVPTPRASRGLKRLRDLQQQTSDEIVKMLNPVVKHTTLVHLSNVIGEGEIFEFGGAFYEVLAFRKTDDGLVEHLCTPIQVL